LKKFRRRHPPFVEIIDYAFFEIEEIGEYFFRILQFSLVRKPREFLCNLVVVEREDDITQIEEDDFDHNPSPPPFRKGRRQEIPPFLKGDRGGLVDREGKMINFICERNIGRWPESGQGSYIL
jgi:hypothetical protein